MKRDTRDVLCMTFQCLNACLVLRKQHSIFRGIDSFGWYNNLRTIIHKTQPNTLIIRKEGHRLMNSDEDSYQLSDAYDRFLDVTVHRHIRIQMN